MRRYERGLGESQQIEFLHETDPFGREGNWVLYFMSYDNRVVLLQTGNSRAYAALRLFLGVVGLYHSRAPCGTRRHNPLHLLYHLAPEPLSEDLTKLS